jgi:hypothetical protein
VELLVVYRWKGDLRTLRPTLWLASLPSSEERGGISSLSLTTVTV